MSAADSSHCASAAPASSARSVALPVLNPARNAWQPGHTRIKHSNIGKWRALVLILVHVVMAAHIIQWLITGYTLTPIEPSESMQTLREGLINAGFIFFITALVSTFLFGRFFCGWGCHVLAFQDLAAWFMAKLRVKPKPFRSRLLVIIPLAFALYMFVWPVVHREVVRPLFADARGRLPEWLGQSNPIPGVTVHLMTKDYWATFAPWYVAIPFMLVCTFAIVYFLGSKAFCTYGCPYGGFFAPTDKLALGKITVNDDCHQCGHCTAVCTSNVRVHEEVRDYGKVIDPGCMKCLDCVSVCPNNALKFSFSTPSIFSRPKDDAAKARAAQARALREARYDLTRPEELVFGLIWLALFWCYRGMLNMVPMLMAIAMAGCTMFLLYKSWRLVKDHSVRMQSLQLKLKGRVTTAGWLTVLSAMLCLAAAVWSGAVRTHLWLAESAFASLKTPLGVALSPAYAPSPTEAAIARTALDHYRAASPPSDGPGRPSSPGGIAVLWPLAPDQRLNTAYIHVLLRDLPAAAGDIRAIIDSGKPEDPLIFQLAQIMRSSSPPASEAEVNAMFADALAKHPNLHAIRGVLAKQQAEKGGGGDRLGALAQWDELLAERDFKSDPAAHLGAAQSLMELEDKARAAILAGQAAALPHATPDHKLRAAALLSQLGETTAAVALAEAAASESAKTSLGATRVAAANQLALLARADRAFEVASLGAADALARGRHIGQADTLFNAGAVLTNLGKPADGLPLVRQAAAIMNAADARPAASGGGTATTGGGGGGWDALSIGKFLVDHARRTSDLALAKEGFAIIDIARNAPGVADSPMFLLEHAQAAYAADKLDVALASMKAAAEIGHTSAPLADRYASLLINQGQTAEGEKWKAEARRRLAAAPQPQPQPQPKPEPKP